jgi:hypothetical protein
MARRISGKAGRAFHYGVESVEHFISEVGHALGRAVGRDSAKTVDENDLLDHRNFTADKLQEDFEKEKKEEYGPNFHDISSHKTRRQRRLEDLESRILDMKRIEKNLVKPDYVSDFPYHSFITETIESNTFQAWYFILVIIFSITMGVEMESWDEDSSGMWFMVDGFFAAAFTLECFLKLYSFGHAYFQVPWFILEFVTTLATIVNLWIFYKGLKDNFTATTTILKCSRIILLSKLFSMREEFQIIILGFTRSFLSLTGVLFVLLVIVYACTLFVYTVVGKYDYSSIPPSLNFDHDAYFGTIARTMLTMFSMLVVSEWATIARAVFEVQPLVVGFFVAFTVMVTFGILNVVTGIIVDTVNGLTSEHKELALENAKLVQRVKLEEVVEVVFHTGDGHEISEDEFKDHASSQLLFDLIGEIDFPHQFSLKDLFTLLDTSGHRMIVKEQFVDGMMRLIYGNDFHRDCQALLSLNKVRRDLILVRKELRAMHLRLTKSKMIAPSGPMPTGETTVDTGRVTLQHGMSFDNPAPWEPSQAVKDWDGQDPPPEDVGVGSDAIAQAAALPALEDFEENPASPFSAWDRLRHIIHAAAVQHCREELKKSWEALENSFMKIEPSQRPKKGVMPSATTNSRSSAKEEEKFFVRNKLCSAVQRQSLQDLERAIDHARSIGYNDRNLSILLTYRDTLRRHHQNAGFSTAAVVEALRNSNWSSALDMVIEVSLAQGADKQMIMSALTRLCVDSSGSTSWQLSSRFGASRAITTGDTKRGREIDEVGRGELQSDEALARSGTKSRDIMKALIAPGATGTSSLGDVSFEDEDVSFEEDYVQRGRLVAVLHTEAVQHAAKELQRAWEKLDAVYRSQELERLRETSAFDGGMSPNFKPFTKEEEHFFLRNQINNAVLQEDLHEMRRGIQQAMALGISPRKLEIEIAYRDALMKHQQTVGFKPQQVTASLQRGDWWTALDDIVAVSFARGADKHMLLKALARVCSTSQSI